MLNDGRELADTRIRQRHDLRLDDATRIMSREWSAEMRRIEAEGLIGPNDRVLQKLAHDPVYAEALRQAKDKVWAHFLERKQAADREADNELTQLTVLRGKNRHLAHDLVQAQTELAWATTKKLQTAQSKADQDSVAACLDLIRVGQLKSGVLLATQVKDPELRRVMEEQLAPIRARLWDERKQILAEHRRLSRQNFEHLEMKYLGL